ncbi:MAG: hypothetical protein QN145_11795 [Armatimonadota bacterium]|nr:hypothetical protein [Armatimonadota bacterium]
MRRYVVLAAVLASSAALAAAAVPDPRWVAVSVSLEGTVQPEGHYYVAFGNQEGFLRGPEPDGEGWVVYVLLHRDRFYLGTVTGSDPPPRLFRFARPPEPYSRGTVAQDRRGWQVEVPLQRLLVDGRPPRWVKVNVVAADGDRRVLDALGRGSEDRVGFVTVDLQREVYRAFSDEKGDAPPGYDLVGGSVTVRVP